MKPWRPDNWKNPYNEDEVYPLGMIAIDRAMAQCFEAGADAILKALNDQRNYEDWLQYLLDHWDEIEKGK